MSETIKLIEGGNYRFSIVNQIQMPGSTELNYIFEGPYQRKYLVPVKYYTDYQLEVGNSVMCIVDKINCTGQVFLEPTHPIYQIGKVYPFALLRIEEVESVFGEPGRIAIVQDDFGKVWECRVEEGWQVHLNDKALSCLVTRISKGHLYLESPDMNSKLQPLTKGWKYPFRVQDEKTIQGEDYLVLTDSENRYHRIPKKYFVKFGLQPGQWILANVVKYDSSGEAILEPDHPKYRLNDCYPFIFNNLETNQDITGNISSVLFLKDCYNDIVKTTPTSWQLDNKDNLPEQIMCRITRIRKGRVFLDPLETN